MKDKLFIIYIPFLLTFTGLTAGYTFLHWALFIDFIPLKEEITTFGIPLALTGLAAGFSLRPKLKILKIRGKNDNGIFFYTIILWFILLIPLIIAQEYIITLGKLIQLNTVSEINRLPYAKYYTIDNYYIDKQKIGVDTEFKVSGKRGESLFIRIYIALPIFDNEKIAPAQEPSAWLGIQYSKKINNYLGLDEKEAEYHAFVDYCNDDFGKRNVSYCKYFDRIGNSVEKDGYKEAIKKNPFYNQTSKNILVGVIEPFEIRSRDKLQWFFRSAVTGSLVWLIMIMIPKIDRKQLNRIKAGKPDLEAQKGRQEMKFFLIPNKVYFITPLLIYINLGIFLIMVIMASDFAYFQDDFLLHWGANYEPLVHNGEWWRLLTCTFIHGGLLHIVNNMVALFFAGIFLEPMLGRIKFLALYLLTGILASATSIWWSDTNISVGASGAIFGLYGFFVAILLTKVYPIKTPKPFLISILIFIGINLLLGLTGNIDNAAHIGGLLSGFVIGLIFYSIIKLRHIKIKM